MSQAVYSDINPAATSGSQLATYLNDFKKALLSSLSGTTRPSELLTGGVWLDTTNAGSPNFTWAYKIYDGTADRTVFTVNLATGNVSIAGSDSLFEISKASDDTVGSLLKLVKARLTGGGQVLIGDVLGEIDYYGTDNGGLEVLSADLKVVANNNFTPSVSGSYFVFSATVTGAGSKTEMMRLIDSRLAIGGVTSPTHPIHARGSGIKSDRLANDAIGAKFILKKARISGTGATQNADIIGQLEVVSTDDATADQSTAIVEVSATQAHTAAALGTIVKVKVMKTGTTTLVSQLEIGDKVEAVGTFRANARELVSQDIATAATITSLNADKSRVDFTGATATDIQGINASGETKVLTIHNKSSAKVFLRHENAGATAANRLKLVNGKDVTIDPDSSSELMYVASESRWKVKSGSGSGGGGRAVSTAQAIADGGTITVDPVVQDQVIPLTGSGTTKLASITPFGTAAVLDGTKVTLIGTDDANPLIISVNDASNGAVGNIPEDGLVIGKYVQASFIRINSLSRWVLED